jgi:hypothetical protein
VLQDENKEICEASNIKTNIIDNDFLFISKKQGMLQETTSPNLVV